MFQEVLSRLTSLGSQIDLMRNKSHALKSGASGSFEFGSSSGSAFPQRHKPASVEFQWFHRMIRTLGFFRQNDILTSIVFRRITVFRWPLSIQRGMPLGGFDGCFRINNYRIGQLLPLQLWSASASKTSRHRKGSLPSCFRHRWSWSIKLDSKPSQMKQSICPHHFWSIISYRAYGPI